MVAKTPEQDHPSDSGADAESKVTEQGIQSHQVGTDHESDVTAFDEFDPGNADETHTFNG